MKSAKVWVLIVSLSLIYNGLVNAQKRELRYGAQYSGKRTDAAMQKFRDNTFGQFIHWGLYSKAGGEWNGVVYKKAAEWLKKWADVSADDWATLADEFNPKKYNPEEWAKMAKEMGAKYATITTKHHEGFCLWPSNYTDFDIASTPYKGDLIGEFVKAYNDQGIDVYLYYSILDWYHPDYRDDIKTDKDSIAFDRYYQFALNQLLELQERYPSVKGFWFDGTWEASWKKNGRYSYEIERALKKVNPGCIVNTRLRADDFGNRGSDANGNPMGDYNNYERRLPKNIKNTKNFDWEACMTMPVNQWGYHKDWSLSPVKLTNEILERLMKAVSLNGNFLLNFGPDAEGQFREVEKEKAREVGKWIQANKNVVYNCGYSGMSNPHYGYYVKNELTNKIYLIVFNIPVSKRLELHMPKDEKLTGAWLNDSRKTALKVNYLDREDYLLTLPGKEIKEPLVIELEIQDKD